MLNTIIDSTATIEPETDIAHVQPVMPLSLWLNVNNGSFLVLSPRLLNQHSVLDRHPKWIEVFEVILECVYPTIHRQMVYHHLIELDDDIYNKSTRRVNWYSPKILKKIITGETEIINKKIDKERKYSSALLKVQALDLVYNQVFRDSAYKFAVHNWLLMQGIPVNQVLKFKIARNRIYASYELNDGGKGSSIFSLDILKQVQGCQQLFCSSEYDELLAQYDTNSEFPIKYWNIYYNENPDTPDEEDELFFTVTSITDAGSIAVSVENLQYQERNKFITVKTPPTAAKEYTVSLLDTYESIWGQESFNIYDSMFDIKANLKPVFEAWKQFFKNRGWKYNTLKLIKVFEKLMTEDYQDYLQDIWDVPDYWVEKADGTLTNIQLDKWFVENFFEDVILKNGVNIGLFTAEREKEYQDKFIRIIKNSFNIKLSAN